MTLAASFFVFSLTGLALLFTLKSVETRRGQVFAPVSRASADRMALALKAQLRTLRRELEKLPPALVYMTRFVLRELALAAARVASAIETQLHNAADMISHKRHFEKHPRSGDVPRSEFLKQMQEGKNGGSPDAGEGTTRS